MKTLSLAFLAAIMDSAQKGRSLVERLDYKDFYRFVDENFPALAVSLSILLAAEWIAVALLTRS